MSELHGDWRARLSGVLWNSGYRQGEVHVRRLQNAAALPVSAAQTLLEEIDEGNYDLLPFFAPAPVALSSRKAWGRQYDRSRGTTGLPREQTPALGTLSDEEDEGLRRAFIDGMAQGFYQALEDDVPVRLVREPEEVESIIRQLATHLDGSPGRGGG